ncbi:cyclin-dependent protein kinase inhibitor SMR3-like [Hevea brasiliensis]|nr:cyclin-dependent protein kinase inhibitor SMR3-like [Hevea brasiliensis]
MSSNSELHLVKENKEDIEFKLLQRSTLEFTALSESSNENGIIPLQWRNQQEEEDDKDGNNETEEDGEERKTGDFSRLISLGEVKATDDDDDDNNGFKTPTSLDHKISATKQCPPAPRKPRPVIPAKRKASPSNVRRSLQLDLSREVESLFPRPILADLYQKMKKARREDDDTL